MKPATIRWLLAAFVLLVWATAVLVDVFSDSYTIDTGLHIGCGGLLGVLLGSGLLSGDNKKDGDGPQ